MLSDEFGRVGETRFERRPDDRLHIVDLRRTVATIFKLIIEDDEGKTTVYPLADGDLTIGRKDGNTIRLMERNVSRRHARLERTNGAVYIQDLDSYNGVKINGERISGKYEVKEGDLVEIGDYHLALQKSVTRSEVPEPARAAGGGPTGGTWPQAGTVPDFQLPDEFLQDSQMPLAQGPNDTIADQAPPTNASSIITETMPPGEARPYPAPDDRSHVQGSLPPFPSSALPPPRNAASDLSTPAVPSQPNLSPGPEVVSSVPRLICVSTNYAGKSFALTRPELIIGRVEDNDIVIEHRSVSRNHAKVLFDGRTHKIIDLQSANGILVNGEEYAMTDLRKGDLIELGHVRFRFVPADEPFRPTAEEAREMKETGVAPPLSAADDPDEPLDVSARQTESSEMPAYDPSQAATVTDAPLTALDASVPNPVVEPAPGALLAPPLPASGTVPPSGGASPTHRIKRATEDERSTELNRLPTSVPVPTAGPVEPSAALARPASTMYEVPEPPRPRRSVLGWAGAVALVAVMAIAVFWAVVVLIEGVGTDDSADLALQQLFDEKRYAEASDLCAKIEGRFSDPEEADRLCRAAQVLTGGARVEPEPLPDEEAAPDTLEPAPEPPPAELAGEPLAGEPLTGEPLAGEPLAGDPLTDEPEIADVVPPPPPRPARAAPKARRVRGRSYIQGLVDRGKRLVLSGDFARAEKVLKECLKLDPDQPDCHRNLGVLYASQDQTPNAIRHYRRYIELRPNAGDASRVREILERFEGAP